MLDLEDWQNKKYQTRHGLPVRVLCIDAPGVYPIVGVYPDGTVSTWTLNGRLLESFNDQHDSTLINAPPKPVTITRWASVHKRENHVDGWEVHVWGVEKYALEYAEGNKGYVAP